MKLLMENWRYYNAKHDFNILCENHKKGRLNDNQLVELWEIQVNSELKGLLSEGLLDILRTGYEKGAQLVGDAKKKYDAALAKVNEWILEKCVQAWQLSQQVKEGLGKVAVVIKTAVAAINKFCAVHPIMCSIAKFLLMMIAVTAALALFSSSTITASDLTAAVAVPDGDGTIVINDIGIDALKGGLQIMAEGGSPEMQQKSVEAYKWLEAAHASETVHELAKSSDAGGEICSNVWGIMKELMASGDEATWKQYANHGKDVFIKSHEYSEQMNVGFGGDATQIKWQSLGH